MELFKGGQTSRKRRYMILRNRRQVNQIRIDVLPDDVLLEIFDFYVDIRPWYSVKTEIEEWQSLVHVCRRWRSLVFRSPLRLNLQLYCAPQTPVKGTLDVWPDLPLIVRGNMASSGKDNVIAALGQTNRVCQVGLTLGWQLENVLAAMQVPFPELTVMQLWSHETMSAIAVPNSFLGGSAPRLRHFELARIPFPGLPKLYLSPTHLVSLRLSDIPHSGYISPEAMAAVISVLSSLRTLHLKFESPQSHPDWQIRSLPPLKRFTLPTFYEFHFKGVTEYLEDLVTFIDAPQLDEMHIDFFNQVDFDCPRLAQFINRTPTLRAHDEARVQFRDSAASVKLRYWTSPSGLDDLGIAISCREPDWQLSAIGQVCNSSLHPLSTVEDFYIEYRYSELIWKNDGIENTLWLQLLLPFTSVKNIYLFKESSPGIAAALAELVAGRIAEVLPRLQNIFVEGLKPSGLFETNIEQFVAARRLSGHPISISAWERGSDMESM